MIRSLFHLSPLLIGLAIAAVTGCGKGEPDVSKPSASAEPGNPNHQSVQPKEIGVVQIVPAPSSSSQSETAGSVYSGKELTAARRIGWQAAMEVVAQLAKSKQPGFTGIDAWLTDFAKQTAGLDPNADPDKWPKVDADALTTHNPHFWRAYYEIAPGDPGAALLYAGILQGCGELARAIEVIQWQQPRPGIPPEVRRRFRDFVAVARSAEREGETFVNEGTSIFDKGDYPVAVKKYQQVLRIWPQCGSAYYELAYTLRVQQLIAAGERPEIPAAGELIMRANSDVDLKVPFSPNVKANYAQCRRYSPFMAEAYVGDNQEVIRGYLALHKLIIPAMKKLTQAGREIVAADQALQQLAPNLRGGVVDVGAEVAVNQAMQQLAIGCQEANVHELALVANQIIVARRGRYDAIDHPFIAASLRKLVPGPDAEAVLERLAGKTATFHKLIATEDQHTAQDSPQVPTQAPEKIFTLGTPQYIQEKDSQDTSIIVVPVQVQKPEQFEKPGLHLAYVFFDETIKTPPTDLNSVEDSFVVNTDDDGHQELVWQVRSAQQSIVGRAHLFMGAPKYKAVGNRGVFMFGFHKVLNKDIGFFVIDNMQPVSNVLVFRKSDFVLGNGEATFQAAVAKLPASDQPGKNGQK